MENNIEYVGKVKIDYTLYSGQDLYEDGSEDELLEIVKEKEPNEYNSVIDEKKSWPILYHLSDIRGNIVESLDIHEDSSVLEIGSGCGAITGSLAKKANKVDCIELSRKRSLVNAYRNRELDNITIRVGNFQDIEKTITEKYDYITLIGVLEYAASYISGEKPYESFLNIIKEHLKPNGKIVVAIENKYGLKYFAGCKEDHLNQYFAGIEGYTDCDTVKTFSKNGLIDLANKCRLNNIKFYYPYPDYKLPLAIYSDKYLPEPGTLTNNFRNFDYDRMFLFDEAKAFDNIVSDGMFDVFSNSYLVILGE